MGGRVKMAGNGEWNVEGKMEMMAVRRSGGGGGGGSLRTAAVAAA